MKKILIGAATLCILGLCQFAEARMPEPSFMPTDLKGGEPHAPQVAHYYLDELVKEGQMTQQEADRTEVYMIFRHARRKQDFKDVHGLSKEERREVMKHKRELRGNPLVEYANYCGISLERATVLMDLMHGSDKGSKYFEKAKAEQGR